ncbi:MAG: branched-chain amino acid ABC transporter permease [Desulfobacteraceae bacterium]|nr:MAG: branched-chain amino acid ABC transporter permease [Desulfobacteraceae bacterium]
MFIQQLFNGIMLGSTYALIAISFTLLMGTLNMLNFAIGEVFMLGAIFGLTFVNLGLSIYVAFPLAMLCTGCACLVIERFSFRPLRNAPPLVPLLSTIGFSILFQNTAENIWGTERSQFPQWMEPVDFYLGPVLISSTQLIILAAAVFFMVGLDLFIQRTRIGRGMRAVAENIETANILGVDSTLIISTTFFVSGALAGASGILFGLSFSIVSPFMGMAPGIKGIAAMIVGGMGNIRGAIVGGMLIGIVEVLSVGYFGALARDFAVYGALFLALVIRPQGILGMIQAEKERI